MDSLFCRPHILESISSNDRFIEIKLIFTPLILRREILLVLIKLLLVWTLLELLEQSIRQLFLRLFVKDSLVQGWRSHGSPVHLRFLNTPQFANQLRMVEVVSVHKLFNRFICLIVMFAVRRSQYFVLRLVISLFLRVVFTQFRKDGLGSVLVDLTVFLHVAYPIFDGIVIL